MSQPLNINELLPVAIQATSQAPVTIGCRALKNSEEQKLELALNEERICQRPLEDLKKALRYVFVLVGLRGKDIPVDEEKQVLVEYIVDNYGGHTPEEIKLAFKMAIQHKLNLEAKDIPCYANFSPAYFTTIMEAYREWAKEQIKQLPAPVERRDLHPRARVDINITWALKCLNEINKLPVKI